MKIVYFSLPGHGHINPTLVLMQELIKRGHDVVYYSSEEYREKIVAAGIPFQKYYYNPNIYERRTSRYVGRFALKLVTTTKSEIPYILSNMKKEKPDLIIHDSYAMWGKFIAHILGVPAVSIFTTMMFPLQMAVRYPKAALPMFADLLKTSKATLGAISGYRKLAREYGIKPDKLNECIFNIEKLNIVFTSSYFQPFAQIFDKSFVFVGPLLSSKSEKADFLQKSNPQKKLIYISMGTIFNNNLTLFHKFINAFTGTPYQVIISLGDGLAVSKIGKTSKNIIVKKYVPQVSVLQKTDLFISHAGMNSINESLYYGVPMILFPQMFEQKINAHRVEKLGAGIYFKKNHFTKEDLLQTVETVLQNKSYSENAKKIKKTLHNAGGYARAAELIEKYI